MIKYLLRRVANGIALVVVVTAVTFTLMYASGGDIARNILGRTATQAQVDARTAELGLDRPLVEQYASWLGGILRGDWGTSYFSSETVVASLTTRIPVTLSIVFVALAITVVVSVAAGVAAARRRGLIDKAVQLVSVVGFALPNYWIALLLVIWIALPFPAMFAATGYITLQESVTGWLSTIVLPSVAIAIGGIATIAQQVRGSMLDVLDRDFIRTLRSRGVSEGAVAYRHALRNAGAPALTVLSVQFVGMLGGTVVIERIFALPGIGPLITTASESSDIPVVMGVVTFMVIAIVIVNLIIDIATAWLNPKARIS